MTSFSKIKSRVQNGKLVKLSVSEIKSIKINLNKYALLRNIKYFYQTDNMKFLSKTYLENKLRIYIYNYVETSLKKYK